MLCSREELTFFNNGEVERYTCSSLFGWVAENSKNGTYSKKEGRLSLCFKTGNLEECTTYDRILFEGNKMTLEKNLQGGCISYSVFIKKL